MSLTLDPDINARVRALVAKMPGATISGVVDELLGASLPLYEDMADAMLAARDADGVMNEAAAKDAIGAAIGARIVRAIGLGVQHTDPASGEGGEDST